MKSEDRGRSWRIRKKEKGEPWTHWHSMRDYGIFREFDEYDELKIIRESSKIIDLAKRNRGEE